MDRTAISELLEERELVFYSNANGCILVPFAPTADRVGFEVYVELFEESVLSVTAIVRDPRMGLESIQSFASWWNRERRWPKAVVYDNTEERAWTLALEGHLPIEQELPATYVGHWLDTHMAAISACLRDFELATKLGIGEVA